MKKTVIKSVVITLACVVATGAIIYVLLLTAFPGALASLYANTGNYGGAVRYESRAYDNSGDIALIVTAAGYAAQSGNNDLIIETVEKFVSDDEFAKYTEDNFEHSTFLTAKYVVARYEKEGGSQALVDKAFSLLVGYASHNQVEYLLVAAYEKGDKDTLRKISVGLDGIDRATLTEQQKVYLDNDKAVIEKALS